MVDLNRITKLKGTVAEKVERTKALAPVYGRIHPSLFAARGNNVPAYSRQNPTKPSTGYSFAKAYALCAGVVHANDCVEEVETHTKFMRFQPGFKRSWFNSLMVPASSDPMYFPDEISGSSDGQSFLKELRQKMYVSSEKADPDEVEYLKAKREKSLGTFPATAGGSLVPPPMLSSEVIDLQRNAQVFTQLGAREVSLPPQGTVRYARQTGASTAYFVGERATITESQLTTGDLELNAKKLAVLTTISQEALLFSNPSAEALARMDMAETAALKADLSMLTGVGGVEMKGVTTYTGDANTYLNIKSYTATGSQVNTNGYTFSPNDVLGMIAALPDAVRFKELRWAMAPTMFQAIANRRADAVTAGDAKGTYLFNTWRSTNERIQTQLDGRPVITSGQISTAVSLGSSANLTYVILAHWPDWMIGRYGAMEMLMNPYGTTYTTDQVQLRAIQFIDAGPRTPNSFVYCNQLSQS